MYLGSFTYSWFDTFDSLHGPASHYWAGQTKRGTTKGAVPLALGLLDGLEIHILYAALIT